MSFLTTKTSITIRDLLVITVFVQFIIGHAVIFRGTGFYSLFEPFDTPISFINIFTVASIVAGALAGFILDISRRRKPLFLMFFVWAVILILPFIWKDPYMVMTILIVKGALYGLIWPTVLVFFADATTVYERGRVSGLVWTVNSLHLAFLFYLVGQSADQWRILMAIEGVALGIIALLVVKERPSLKQKRKRISNLVVFRDRNLLLYASVIFIVSIFYSTNQYLTGYLMSDLLSSTTFWSYASLSMGISALLVGYLTDRIGRKPVIVFGALFLSLGFLIFFLNNNIMSLILNAITFGVGLGCIYIPLIFSIPGDISKKESRGRVYSLLVVGMLSGNLIGSTLGQNLAGQSVTILALVITFSAFLIILPTMAAKETVPLKETLKEAQDHIKSILDKKEEES
jgi:MFS family permease